MLLHIYAGAKDSFNLFGTATKYSVTSRGICSMRSVLGDDGVSSLILNRNKDSAISLRGFILESLGFTTLLYNEYRAKLNVTSVIMSIIFH